MRYVLLTLLISMMIAGVAYPADLQIKDAKMLKRVERELSLRLANDRLLANGILVDPTNEGTDLFLKDFTDEQLVKALVRDDVSTIYGPDSRVEAVLASIVAATAAAVEAHAVQTAAAEAKLARNLDGVAGIVLETQLTFDGVQWHLTTEPYKTNKTLCDNTTKFDDQPVAPFCTAFLVGSRVLVTAGHCYRNLKLAETRFVFGFKGDKSPFPDTFKNDDIYSGVDLVTGSSDYAIVTLNRDVVGRTPLPVDRVTKVRATDEVYVIGHPAGLPLKYAPGANVRSVGFDTFTANLDVLGGNSGSPVFLASSHDVIGMHIVGDDGYQLAGTCYRLQECPTGQDCLGEGCLKADFIPAIQTASAPPAQPAPQP